MRRRGTEERRRIAAHLRKSPGHTVHAAVQHSHRPRSPRLDVHHRTVSPVRQTSPVRQAVVSPTRLQFPQGHSSRKAIAWDPVAAGRETNSVVRTSIRQSEKPNYAAGSPDVTIQQPRSVHSNPLELNTEPDLSATTDLTRLLDSHELRMLRQRLKAASYGGVSPTAVPGQRPQTLLQQYDLTNRGALSQDEFRKLVRTGGRLGPTQISDAMILRIFRTFDTSKSGLISLHDLTHLVWNDDGNSIVTSTQSVGASTALDKDTYDRPNEDVGSEETLDRGLQYSDGTDSHKHMQSELVSWRTALLAAERERDEAVAAAATAVQLGARAASQFEKLEKCLHAARRDGRIQRSKRVLHSALLAWRLVSVSGSRQAAEEQCRTLKSQFAEADRLQQEHASSVAGNLRKAEESEVVAAAAAQSYAQQVKRLEQDNAALYAEQERACRTALLREQQLLAGRALVVRLRRLLHPYLHN